MEEEEKKLFEELREKYGTVAAFRAPSGEFVVIRKMNSGERKRMLDLYKTDHARAHKESAQACVVHPARDAAKELLEKWPGMYDKLANRAYELAGGDVEELGKD